MISNFIGNLILIFFLVNLLYIGKTTNTISNYDASIENYNLTSHLEVNITEINLINEGKGGKEVKIVDTYAYVLDDNGFKVFDITEPMNEILLYDYSTAGYLGHTLTISGDYAIAGSCDNGLTIFNISDSDYPTFVGSYFIGGCYGDLSSNGSILYTSSSISGFVIISIENPSSPTILGNYSGLFYSFLIENDTTFISSTDGLMILDIKDPYNITEIGFFDYEGIVSIEKQNNFLFLGVPNGLLIIDVADKTKINQISFLNTGGYIVDLKFNNSFLYYTQQGEKGFGIIDITNKTNPTKLEFVNFSGAPLRFDITGDFAYVSDQANGLRVLLIKFEIDEPNSSTEMSLDTTTDNNSSTQSTVENSLGNSLQFTLLSLILMTLVIKFSRKSKI